MVNNNEEKLNKNNEVSLEEAEVYLAEAEVAEAKEFMRDEEIKLFLIMYIISNVLYYPIMQEVLHGKTLAKKFIFR